ncbi:MAG: 2Fe-2S iron-sulfur cluster-binding protein [Pseudomonadota bacterium]
MAKLVFVDFEGKEREIEASNGETVMEVAVKNAIPGIDADCGGACACATCHVYVDEAFLASVGEPEAMEQSMLDFAENVQPNSRLCCQISVSDALNGLRVTTPESQH